MTQPPLRTHDASEDSDAELAALTARLAESEARYVRTARERDRLRKILARVGESASSAELRRLRQEVNDIRGSTIWRASAPVRLLLDVLRNPRAIAARVRPLYALVRSSAANDGWSATIRKIERKLRQRISGAIKDPGKAIESSPLLRRRSTGPSASRLALRVLLIAETTLPQCFKYRVAQKREMIEYLGYECTIIPWRQSQECMRALQTHAVIVFYRVPGFPEVMRMIDEAKRLRVPTLWEVDDLIFDAGKYASNSNLKDLTSAEMAHLLSDAAIYKKAMVACDACIASTPALAEAMQEAGAKEAHVVQNALDGDSVRTGAGVRGNNKPNDGAVRIVYGSGTRTHDTDFRLIAPAVLAILQRYGFVRLRIVGQLNLPAEFEQFAERVERVPLSNYATYLSALGECDINIAPLDNSVFSDAKSNIKFLEGALVGLPSVCSPRSAFRSAITNGEDGFLAEGVEEWHQALATLVDDQQLRTDMGAKALRRTLEGYGYTSIAKQELLPILCSFERRRAPLTVLAVNIFFEPRSFGGATVVAEEMAKALNALGGVDYHVFTSLPTAHADEYQLVRYDAKGAIVFGMGLPSEADPMLDYDNPYVLSAFSEALRAVRPNVVHLHSVQGIGAAITDICQAEGIPYVVTLHDAWWICARQFMITPANKYCHQKKIDLDVCASLCVDRTRNEPRQMRLHEVLEEASLLLSPSAFFRDIYVANGFEPTRVVVNKNGVVKPSRPRKRQAKSATHIRFGYVGGDSHIKGAHLLKNFFATTPLTNYELVVVDNTVNLGMRSISAQLWKCTGTLTIRPAYTQATIDDFFDSIDVLLFPTQWKESFGLTVREALIRDVWVVATDAGGVVEDIVDGENGNIVPFSDDGTVLDRVLTDLLRRPAQLADFQNAYKDRIRTVEMQAAELRDFLFEVQGTPLHHKAGLR